LPAPKLELLISYFDNVFLTVTQATNQHSQRPQYTIITRLKLLWKYNSTQINHM